MYPFFFVYNTVRRDIKDKKLKVEYYCVCCEPDPDSKERLIEPVISYNTPIVLSLPSSKYIAANCRLTLVVFVSASSVLSPQQRLPQGFGISRQKYDHLMLSDVSYLQLANDVARTTSDFGEPPPASTERTKACTPRFQQWGVSFMQRRMRNT